METNNILEEGLELAIEVPEFSNEDRHEHKKTLQIGDMAPNFTATTTLGSCALSDFKGKWLCFFSHIADFTGTCTSEIISFNKAEEEFKKRNCCLLGLSGDSIHSHLAWIHNINNMTRMAISFPLIADSCMEISKIYNMSNSRTMYLICPEGKIKAILTYPKEIGRNISEILRLLDALQYTHNENLCTPANWGLGMPGIMPAPMCYHEVMERVKNPGELNCLDYYLCFKPTTNVSMPIMQDHYNCIM